MITCLQTALCFTILAWLLYLCCMVWLAVALACVFIGSEFPFSTFFATITYVVCYIYVLSCMSSQACVFKKAVKTTYIVVKSVWVFWHNFSWCVCCNWAINGRLQDWVCLLGSLFEFSHLVGLNIVSWTKPFFPRSRMRAWKGGGGREEKTVWFTRLMWIYMHQAVCCLYIICSAC